MQKRVQQKGSGSSVIRSLRQAAAHVSVAAMIGVGTVSVVLPVAVHAQQSGGDTVSTYPEALISPYQASQAASGSGQGVVAGSPVSGSGYFPYVDSAHAGTWNPQVQQQADVTPAAVVLHYGPYVSPGYEAYVAARDAAIAREKHAAEDISRYEPFLYLDYLAKIRPADSTGAAVANSDWEIASLNYRQMDGPTNASMSQSSAVASASETNVGYVDLVGTIYEPCLESADLLPCLNGMAAAVAAQGAPGALDGSALVITPDGWFVAQDHASAMAVTSVDLLGSVYADSQTPIEQQTYQKGSAGAVVAAPATPIASVDVMRYVYADSQTPIEQQAHQQTMLAKQRAGTADVLRGPYQFERARVAAGATPTTARGPVPAQLARAVYGDENFLFWAPGASAIVESEPGPAQAFITPHRPGDAI